MGALPRETRFALYRRMVDCNATPDPRLTLGHRRHSGGSRGLLLAAARRLRGQRLHAAASVRPAGDPVSRAAHDHDLVRTLRRPDRRHAVHHPRRRLRISAAVGVRSGGRARATRPHRRDLRAGHSSAISQHRRLGPVSVDEVHVRVLHPVLRHPAPRHRREPETHRAVRVAVVLPATAGASGGQLRLRERRACRGREPRSLGRTDGVSGRLCRPAPRPEPASLLHAGRAAEHPDAGPSVLHHQRSGDVAGAARPLLQSTNAGAGPAVAAAAAPAACHLPRRQLSGGTAACPAGGSRPSTASASSPVLAEVPRPPHRSARHDSNPFRWR